MINNFNRIETGFEAVQNNSRLIFVDSRIGFQYLQLTKQGRRVPTLIGKDNVLIRIVSAAFPKRSSLYTPINFIIQRLVETGFGKFIADQVFCSYKVRKMNKLSKQEIPTLKLNHLISIFILWSFGILLSFFIFIGELIIQKLI